jgi:hypothetical protein
MEKPGSALKKVNLFDISPPPRSALRADRGGLKNSIAVRFESVTQFSILWCQVVSSSTDERVTCWASHVNTPLEREKMVSERIQIDGTGCQLPRCLIRRR